MSINPKLNKKITNFLFGTRAAGFYILFFATAIGIATFIENDFGTSSAQKVVFKTTWFELLLVLFSITLVVNIKRFQMVEQKKWALIIFHLSMVIIIIGAGVTRYFGYEGMMHIRENDQSSQFLSAETYLKYEVIKNGNKYQFDEPVLFATLGNNKMTESYLIGNDLLETEVEEFIPNPVQVMESNDRGFPILKIVIGGKNGREEYYISPGESKKVRNLIFNFTENYRPETINIKYEKENLFIKANRTLTQMDMATQTSDTLTPRDEYYPLRLVSLYSDGLNGFVFGDFNEKAIVKIESEDRKVKNESLTALRMNISLNGNKNSTYVFGQKGMPGRPSKIKYENLSLAISYGSKYKTVPFAIRLKEFIMEKYPGTNSAASYASEVQLIDNRQNLKFDYRIFMNNILDHDGYRFFQSSFDQDEKGTLLSVNHDFVGTWITYIGYALLTIGMIMLFFTKNSRFYKVSQKLKKMNHGHLSLVVLMLFTQSIFSQKTIAPTTASVSESHSQLFSTVIVQDHKGRMKPMHTLSREFIRKLARKESINSLSADQIVLNMFADKHNWLTVPMIKISSNSHLHEILGTTGPLAAFKDFFQTDGEYKLEEEVRRAYGLQPIDRGQFDKDVMKIDERVNIASMIYSGRIFKIIPVPEHKNNEWASAHVDHKSEIGNVQQADKFFSTYKPALSQAIQNGDYSLADKMITELKSFQKEKGSQVIPSDTQLNLEILLNKLNVFSRLSLYYSILGFIFLLILFTSVFKPKAKILKYSKYIIWLVIAGFLFHTIGLGIRWYVSERAPWSNGYESMIYIAWTTTLAGIIFTRKSLGGLAATMILAGTILLTAMLSYLDPEITPLVPVLRSYWLTIHVSLIAGSYGFLMLGAIIGIINLLLMIFLTENNKKRIKEIITEMTYISELTLVGGLVMISIGTYLGGVWANESWGRYWGWDAKETWALVTILVYAFILHMRIIPKMYSLYSFNVATLFGFASVAMTYFGVNYYLSGLHSYAAGDPVPIPTWVYIAVVCVIIVSVLAFWRKRTVKM
ncbi:MAG: cytochrome c-type biogenesis protein CcsB [Halioglobus sp.]|jgi:cytochrome c-type biogenesis protein CcsB